MASYLGMQLDKVRNKIGRSKSLSYSNSQKMPACVPGQQHNAVADINANTDHKPPGGNESTFNKIMSCLFWKKKTDVVDMKKDSQAMKKQKMTVDRSERSRRVLKMETMREVPQARAEGDDSKRHMTNGGTKQMFLPSENPTASFLSNLNPSVRRACSDVIRSTSNSNTNRNGSREAFGESSHHSLTRNTNYRAKRASDRKPKGNMQSDDDDDDKPPPLPTRNKKGSMVKSRSKPIVVPGTMICSDDDIGYNTENDIDDLHDELRRMNISQPELRDVGRAASIKSKRQEGSITVSECSLSDRDFSDCRNLSDRDLSDREFSDREFSDREFSDRELSDREGSISLSEGNGSCDEHNNNQDRPQNPAPNQASTTDKESNTSRKGNRKHSQDPKNKSMEQVIDELFVQTQSNIDTIYQNGLEHMEDLETFRCETATPETCMKRLEDDLMKSSMDADKATSEKKTQINPKNKRKIAKTDSFVKRNVVTHGINGVSTADDKAELCDEYTPEMDSLLTEVSSWAKDRQSWLLEDSKLSEENTNTKREDTETSFKTDDRVIDQVSKSNSDKSKSKSDTCTDWVESQNKRQKDVESKMSGILTGPKLFRSVSRNNGRKVSFNEKRNTVSRAENNETRQSCRSNDSGNKSDVVHLGTGKNVDLTQNSGHTANVGNVAPWSSDMYTSTPRRNDAEDDRDTLDDNLSELDQKIPYRARSPDSWLSSIGSCTNLKKESNIPHNDSFDTTSLVTAEPPKPPKKSSHLKIVSDPAKSHQIIRQAPKIHTPFRPMDREVTPMPHESSYNPVAKPLVRNTQLQPLNKPQRQDSVVLNSFPSLPGMKNSDVMNGTRNMNLDSIRATQSFSRPFSEIPLRTSSFNVPNRNSNLMANSGPFNYDTSPQYVERPVSETISPKRHDKIGTGQIMATESTKERARYAKDIVNNIQKQRFKPQDAFNETNKATTVSEKFQAIEGEQVTKNKRHKVFDNSLLKGGYNYEKHSRRKPPDPPTETASPPRDTAKVTATGGASGINTSPNRGEIAGASISELTINFKDNTADHQYGGGVSSQGRTRLSGNSFNLGSSGYNAIGQSNTNDGNKTNVAIGGRQKMRTPPGKPTNQNHQTHGLVPPQLDQTAGRFKRLRNRRDQEMDWLMRDAAETEV